MPLTHNNTSLATPYYLGSMSAHHRRRHYSSPAPYHMSIVPPERWCSILASNCTGTIYHRAAAE
jgi:hypothetical protein|eukprot:COSAG01_NODE_518_length_16019_cov_9.486809_7_plen_64_part_00